MDYSPHQAPLSMGFSRQEYWSGLPFPPPGELPDPRIKPSCPASAADSLAVNHQGSPFLISYPSLMFIIFLHISLFIICLSPPWCKAQEQFLFFCFIFWLLHPLALTPDRHSINICSWNKLWVSCPLQSLLVSSGVLNWTALYSSHPI